MYGGATATQTSTWALDWGGLVITNGWSGTGTSLDGNHVFTVPFPSGPTAEELRQARRARSRAKPIPPVHIPGDPKDRVLPLRRAALSLDPIRPAATWLTPRIGRTREQTSGRSRRRLRTWERDEAA